jgi:hypothetical protein
MTDCHTGLGREGGGVGWVGEGGRGGWVGGRGRGGRGYTETKRQKNWGNKLEKGGPWG